MARQRYESSKVKRTALCPYYSFHRSTYIMCEGIRVTRQEYSVKDDCCNHYKKCPQYKYLTYYYEHKE